MEKFNKLDVVITTIKEKSVVVIVSWPLGSEQGKFKGTVIYTDWNFYKVGEYSDSWNESKFEVAPKGLEFKITT